MKTKNTWQGKSGVYLIAEIGGNHEGDFGYAKDLTHLACSSGADSVKFQIYTGESLVNPKLSPDRYEHFRKFELKPEQYIELAEICSSHNVNFSASIWDISAFSWINPYVTWHKIGSGDLTAYPVIEKIVSLKKPIILSTGLSTMAEVKATVDYIQKLDPQYNQKENLAILQCTSMYPIPDEDANLNVISALRNEFNLTTGYSDHTVGTDAACIAAAMGAEIIEMHFTDSREGKTFRDHMVSFTKEEILDLSKKIHKMRNLQGSFDKKPTTSEIQTSHNISFRRGVFLNKDLNKGSTITKDDLVVLRPCQGLGAEQTPDILNKSLNKNIKALEPLSLNDFE